MRVLFVTATRVGDAILSTGLLDHLIRTHPEARITIACGPATASLFPAVPGLEKLIVLDKMVASLHWLGLWAACIGRRWDILIDLRKAPITYLIWAGRRFAMGRSRPDEHRLVQLARVLGLEAQPPPPHVWTGAAARERALRLIPDGPPVLAIGPTANWIGKTWRAERFVELSERLCGPQGILPGARVAVFGRDDERPQALPVLEAIPEHRRIDLVLGLDLQTVHACLARAAFYVGNDSGLMHLAASAGIPTLGLFGPSQEVHYAPCGPLAAAVRTEQTYDTIFPPDFDHRTTGTLMDGLSVDAAAVAAQRLWHRVREVAV